MLIRSDFRLREQKERLYVKKMTAAYLGLISSLFCVKFIPVTEATTIMMTAPLLALILGKLFLNEPFGIYEGIMVSCTFAGTLAVINPVKLVHDLKLNNNITDHVIGLALSFVTALSMATCAIMFRKLKNVHFSIVMFWGGVSVIVGSVFLVCIFGDVSQPHNPTEIVISISAAVSGVLVQMFLILALKYANAGPVLIVRSIEIVFVIIYQVIFFDDHIFFTTVLGSILIFISIILANTKTWILSKVKKENIEN